MNFKIKKLKVSEIKPDKDQPRKTFEDESIQHLAESILSNGILNPIEVDDDYIITDGERRLRACKIAGLKTVTVRVVGNKDKTEKLRRQLIFTLQDEEIPTEEKYQAIVKLYKMCGPHNQENFCKTLGITRWMLDSAFKYCNFVEEEPEIAKKVSPHIIIETASLPKEERKEVLKEFEGMKDKKKDLIRELVKEKKEKVEQKKEIEKLRQEKSAREVKIITDRERLWKLRDEVIATQNEFNKLMVNIRWMRKKTFFFQTARDKDNFYKFLEGASERARKWADELDDLRENIELELMGE